MKKFEKYFVIPIFNLELKMNNWVDDFKKWVKYIKCPWFRNHSLGMRMFITNKKGVVEYCYRCGNFSNYVITKLKIFNVPICRKHFDEESQKLKEL